MSLNASIALGNAAENASSLSTIELAQKYPDQVVWLTQEPKTLALLRSYTGNRHRGTVILIPDTQAHPDTPKYIAYLRNQLRPFGWNTLALTLPRSAAEPSWEAQQQQMSQLMQTAVTFAANYPGAILVFAEGASAAALLPAISPALGITGFVHLSAYTNNNEANQALAKQVLALKIPQLDLTTPFDNPQAHSAWQQRQHGLPSKFYRHAEVRLLAQPGYEHLLRQIEGWTRFLGL